MKPLFKKGDTSQVSNYRPNPLLTICSKIYELLIFQKLKQHLVSNNILANEKFGFRDNVSTDSAIFRLIGSISNARNSEDNVTGLLCDLSKTFNRISHELLISKMEFYGVKGSILNWLKFFCIIGNKDLY
jgi:hypothetical protein